MNTAPQERLAKNTPLKVIEYIIAITTVLGGLLLLTPLIAIPVPAAGDPEIVKQILSRPGIIALGIVAVVCASAHAWGLFKNKFLLRSIGLFFNILIRIYAILAGWLIDGEVPLPVSSEFVMLYIVIVLWLTLRLEKWTGHAKEEKEARAVRLREAGLDANA